MREYGLTEGLGIQNPRETRILGKPAGHGLEVLVRYNFYSPRKAIMWANKRLSEADRKIKDKF